MLFTPNQTVFNISYTQYPLVTSRTTLRHAGRARRRRVPAESAAFGGWPSAKNDNADVYVWWGSSWRDSRIATPSGEQTNKDIIAEFGVAHLYGIYLVGTRP